MDDKFIKEQWEKIPGYEGFEASTLARIRRTTDGRILKVGKGKGWVRQVVLPGYGLKCLHLLVSHTFLGPCPTGNKVKFNDGNPYNCQPENLSYGPAERKHGRGSTLTTKGGAQKIPYEQRIREIWQKLLPKTELLLKREP